MCEANAFFLSDDDKELILECIDAVEQKENGQFLLVNFFGEQKTITAKIKSMSLVDHKIFFEK